MSARAKDPAWFTFLAARWKAIAALAGTLATSLIVVFPGNHALQLVIAVVGALVTTGVVHQVPGPSAPAATPDGIGASIGIDLPGA